MRIECRCKRGERHPENDLDVEIYRSGSELNFILSWSKQIDVIQAGSTISSYGNPRIDDSNWVVIFL